MNSAARKQLALLLLLALAVRLAAALTWQSRWQGKFAFPDSESYWALGRAIARGRPYRFGLEGHQVFRTPGYPLLLAPIFRVGGDQPSVMWARAESAVLGTMAVGVVWWLARELFDHRTGLIAAAVATFYPGAVVMSALVLSEAPFGLVMLVQMALWTAAWKAGSWPRAGILAASAGLVAGAATLIRPSWLLFTPLAVVTGFVVGGRCGPAGRCRGLDAHGEEPCPPVVRAMAWQAWLGVWVLAGLLLAVMPWWIRNARLTGRFVPTTLQVGASLYDGLNPKATGASNMDFVSGFAGQLRRQPPGEGGQRGDTFEYRLDRRLRSEALAWARSNPARVIRLAGIKLRRTWNVWPNEATLSTWPIRLVVLFTYVPVLIFGIIGAARTIRRGWPYLLCWLPAVYFTLLHVAFVGSIRYRQPAMLGMMVLAAGILGARKRGEG